MEVMKKTGPAAMSKFDLPPYTSEHPVDVSAVVDPSAAATDPDNDKFVPSNTKELKLTVLALIDSLDESQVAKVFHFFKDAIEKMHKEEEEMAKEQNVEEVVRTKVRKMLGEAELPPVRKIPFGVSGTDFLEKMKKSLQASLKNLQLDDNEAVISDIAGRVKSGDPIGSIKRATRYLKDNVPGDVGKNLDMVIDAVSSTDPETAKAMKDAVKSNPGLIPKSSLTTAGVGGKTREQMAQAFGEKHGTTMRAAEERAMEKIKKVATRDEEGDFSMKDEASIVVMMALQDFIEHLKANKGLGLFKPSDIDLFKSNPSIAAELGTFRVFLDPYLDELVEDPEDANLRKIAAAAGARKLDSEIKKLKSGKPGELEHV